MFCDALPSRSRSFTLSELFSMASSSRSELPDLNLLSNARLPLLGPYQQVSESKPESAFAFAFDSESESEFEPEYPRDYNSGSKWNHSGRKRSSGGH